MRSLVHIQGVESHLADSSHMGGYDYSWDDQDPDQIQSSLEFPEPYDDEWPTCGCCDDCSGRGSEPENCSCEKCDYCEECRGNCKCANLCFTDDCYVIRAGCDCERCDECCDCKLLCQRCGDKNELCVCPRCVTCGEIALLTHIDCDSSALQV